MNGGLLRTHTKSTSDVSDYRSARSGWSHPTKIQRIQSGKRCIRANLSFDGPIAHSTRNRDPKPNRRSTCRSTTEEAHSACGSSETVTSRTPRSLRSKPRGQVDAALERAKLHDAAERKRKRAELITEVLTAIESVDGVIPRARRLLELLVPRIADYGSVEAPYESDFVLAVQHRDPSMVPVLRTLRQDFRLGRAAANSMFRAADGEGQLISTIDPERRGEYRVDEAGRALLERLGPLSHIAVPLDPGGGVNGALMLGISDSTREPFGAEDRSLAAAGRQRLLRLVPVARRAG
jgi:hypothetical protein